MKKKVKKISTVAKNKKPALKKVSASSSRVNKKSKTVDFLSSEDVFYVMIQNSANEILLVDKGGKIVFANHVATDNLSCPCKNIVGQCCTQFLHNKISPLKWKNLCFDQIKRKKRTAPFVSERVIKKGYVQTIETYAVYLKHKQKEFILYCSRDITSQTSLQKRLVESQEKYRLLTEQAVAGIVTIDLDGSIVYANRAAEKMVGAGFSGPKGSNFSRYINKGSIKRAMEMFSKVVKGIPTESGELEIVDKDGNAIPVDITVSPIFKDGKVAEVNIIVRDSRKRKRYEQLERENEKQIALHEVISGTTREIQTPLMGLHNSAKKMLAKYQTRYFEYIGYKEFKEIMDTVNVMKDQIKYCYDTTERLLDLNKKKIGFKDSKANVNMAAKEAVRQTQHLLDVSEVSVKLKLRPNIPHAAMRGLELNQVIASIITNAIQAMPSGGNIVLTTRYLKSEEMLGIDCKDDGVGIPKEILSRVFDPFFTTKQRGLEKNSGLGLSIAHSLIKAAKGKIEISSVFRKGTSVKILIPTYKSPKKKSRK